MESSSFSGRGYEDKEADSRLRSVASSSGGVFISCLASPVARRRLLKAMLMFTATNTS